MIVNLSSPQNNYFERTDTLKRYYEDIRKYAPLTMEREQTLINQYHKSKSAHEKKKLKDENRVILFMTDNLHKVLWVYSVDFGNLSMS